MKKIIVFTLSLLILVGCEKSTTNTNEKVYSKQAITEEWKKMGDASPLYQEANNDCAKELDKGNKPQDIKACLASSTAKQLQCQKERLDYFNKNKKWIPRKEYKTQGCA